MTELDASANVTKWYLRGSGLGGGIGDMIAIQYPASSNQDQYLSYNHRGDVVELTTKDSLLTARYEYTAFGTPLTPTTSVRPLTFSSKEYDTKSGLSYYGYRYYDPETARWLTKDPLNYNSKENNFYMFALNSPIQLVDSYGLKTSYVRSDCFIFIIAAHASAPDFLQSLGRLLNDKRNNFRVGVSTCFIAENINSVFEAQGKGITDSPRNTTRRLFHEMFADVKRMWKQADKDAQQMMNNKDLCCKCVVVQVQCPEDAQTAAVYQSVNEYLGDWCGKVKTKGDCFP
jgi:RHS repeat-associated protein